MQHRDGEKCVEADGETFPAQDQAAVLPREPGTWPLGLVARNAFCDGPPSRAAVLPHACGNLWPAPASAQAMTESFGLIPLIHGPHLEAFTWSAPLARAAVEGIQPRDALGSLMPMGRRGARGQRHASTVREAVDEDAWACAAIGPHPHRHLCQGEQEPSTAPYCHRIRPRSSASPSTRACLAASGPAPCQSCHAKSLHPSNVPAIVPSSNN